MTDDPPAALLSIGGFAPRSRLTVKALRIYERVGLLRPATVEKTNGYRPYSTDQIRSGQPIALLRSAGSRPNEIAKAKGWSGISAQAYALKAMILQVQPVAARDTRIYEVHPEVSFARANHETPLRHSKASWNGITLRRRVLADQGILIPDDLEDAGVAGVADILNAAIAAWSAARIAAGAAEPFPRGGTRIETIWR